MVLMKLNQRNNLQYLKHCTAFSTKFIALKTIKEEKPSLLDKNKQKNSYLQMIVNRQKKTNIQG